MDQRLNRTPPPQINPPPTHPPTHSGAVGAGAQAGVLHRGGRGRPAQPGHHGHHGAVHQGARRGQVRAAHLRQRAPRADRRRQGGEGHQGEQPDGGPLPAGRLGRARRRRPGPGGRRGARQRGALHAQAGGAGGGRPQRAPRGGQPLHRGDLHVLARCDAAHAAWQLPVGRAARRHGQGGAAGVFGGQRARRAAGEGCVHGAVFWFGSVNHGCNDLDLDNCLSPPTDPHTYLPFSTYR